MAHYKGWKPNIQTAISIKWGQWKSTNHHVYQGFNRNKGWKPFKNKVLRRVRAS